MDLNSSSSASSSSGFAVLLHPLFLFPRAFFTSHFCLIPDVLIPPAFWPSLQRDSPLSSSQAHERSLQPHRSSPWLSPLMFPIIQLSTATSGFFTTVLSSSTLYSTLYTVTDLKQFPFLLFFILLWHNTPDTLFHLSLPLCHLCGTTELFKNHNNMDLNYFQLLVSCCNWQIFIKCR